MIWIISCCVLFVGSVLAARTLEYGIFVTIVFSFTITWGLIYAIHRAWRVRLCLHLVRKSLEHNLPYTNLQELIEPDYGNPPDFKHPAKAGLIGLITYIPCIFLSWTALGLFMSSFVLKLILAIIIGFVVSFIIGLVTTKLAAEKRILKKIVDSIQRHDKRMWEDLLHSWKRIIDEQNREAASRTK